MSKPTVRVSTIAASVIALGGVLRLYGLREMEFKTDEFLAINLATDLLADRPWSSPSPWPAHGMLSSAWVANAPLFTWIVALVWSISEHPIAVAAFVALVNTLALLPLWLWARRRMDESRALVTLAITAVSPFAVLYSRKIWTQDLLFPGLVCVLWGIELLPIRFWRGVIVLVLGSLLVGQLHQSGAIAIALLPLAAVIQWIAGRNRLGITLEKPSFGECVGLLLVCGASLFFWVPYVGYLTTLDWQHLPPREMAGSYRARLLLNLINQLVPWDLLAVFRVHHDAFVDDVARRVTLQVSIWLATPLTAYGLWRWVRSPLTLPVVGIWWWLVIGAFMLARIPGRPFYTLVLAPLPALLAGGAFDSPLPARFRRVVMAWRWAYAASLLALTLLTGAWLFDRGGAGGDYGVAFDIREGQARHLAALRTTSGPLALERAQLAADESADLECHGIPNMVSWLVGWIDRTPPPNLAAFQLCDQWVGTGGDGSVYRWSIRRAPVK